jgi:hypothetical protein
MMIILLVLLALTPSIITNNKSQRRSANLDGSLLRGKGSCGD